MRTWALEETGAIYDLRAKVHRTWKKSEKRKGKNVQNSAIQEERNGQLNLIGQFNVRAKVRKNKRRTRMKT